jgi:hypothetical protein
VKRRAFKVLLFLLAGAIINVAVAWALATNWHVFAGGDPTVHHRQIRRAADSFWHGQSRDSFWQGQCKYRTGGVWFEARFVRGENSESDIGEYRGDDAVPAWSGFAIPTAEFVSGQADAVWRWGDGRGWPLVCLWSETRRYIDSLDTRQVLPVQWGIETTPLEPRDMYLSNPRVLPLRPIWPNFAINTIFYAAIVWFMFFAPGAIRKRVRRKRGQCAACGYSLRGTAGDVCSECGATA